ncbi:MAG: hypothetical protein M1824_004798 [Vezdaea acicularis]|nr:MAG: hypothetical protein M1824_004798 [Vezdaea acicularis]
MATTAEPLINGNGLSRRQHSTIKKILNTRGPFTDADWVPGKEAITQLEDSRVLVIGAGGLGCEMLKDLALSGFKDIHVIDMDTIDVSNLNRQFLFRQADVGKYKAEVAADFVSKRIPGIKVTPHCMRIEEKPDEFYMQFKMILSGLDSISARRWINNKLVSLVDDENPESLKPLIDGGTEGFKGQAKVILPTLSSCIECQMEMHAPRAAVPLCTLATIPRQPEHCIEWAKIMAWPEERKGEELDNDDPAHITWLYDKALARAESYNISGVTYSLTQGVVKNIIPAIASTNATIAAACCAEALKIATGCNPYLDNYMMYVGDAGAYTFTFRHEQKPDCPVCGNLPKDIGVDPAWTVEEFIDRLVEMPEAQVKKVSSIRTGRNTTIWANFMEAQTNGNLEKNLKDFVEEAEELDVTDAGTEKDRGTGVTLRFIVRFTK